MNNNYLQHYGVPGMKWGVHRASKSGTNLKKSNREYSSDGKYKEWKKSLEVKSTKSPLAIRKQKKLYKSYDKAVDKDIKEAIRRDDMVNANRMSADRTYAKMAVDRKYAGMTIGQVAIASNVKAGEEFVYDVTKNRKDGTVKVTVNGHTEQYVYDPSGRYVKKRNKQL